MPKVPPRARTPPTPRMSKKIMRRSALYGANTLTPFLKEKNVKEVDGDTLIRPSLDGISFASEIPSSQQMAERNAGFMRRQKVSQKATPAWYVGTSNKIGTYSAEPKQLLRYGLAGAQHFQRGRMSKDLQNTEWTPKLIAHPVPHSGPIAMCSPHLWPDESAYVSGAAALKNKQAKKQGHPSWFASETTVQPHVMSEKLGLRSSQMVLPREKPAMDANEVGKQKLVSERLIRNVQREADNEAAFEVQVAATRRRQARALQRAAGPILTDGLGPEARLKVLRRHKASPSVSSSNVTLSSRQMRTQTRKNQKSGKQIHQKVAPVPAHERRKARRCGSMLVCVESRNDLDVAEEMRKQGATEQRQSTMKWQLLGRFHAKWYQFDKVKGANFSYHPLVKILAEAAEDNPDCHTITRDQFMSCTLLRLRDVNLAHRLYTSMDEEQTDRLPWISIVLPLVMLAAAQGGAGQREVLLLGLELIEAVTPPLTIASTLAVLTVAAGSRLEKLEIQSRFSMGGEFALRAAAAAADLTEGLPHGDSRRKSRQSYSPPSPVKRYVSSTNITPELVLQMLQEYPELADTINQQLSNRFAAAGRARPSLAVVGIDEDDEPDDKAHGGGGLTLRRMSTQKVPSLRTSRQATARLSRSLRNSGQQRRNYIDDDDGDSDDDDDDDNIYAGDEGLHQGVLKGDKRKSTLLFPANQS